jgi:mRNA interferase HigB
MFYTNFVTLFCNFEFFIIFAAQNINNAVMRIIAKKTLTQYAENHPQAAGSLNDWFEKTRKAEWNNLTDIRQTFNSVDYVGNQLYVFNINGNNYRLVVLILMTSKTVYIRFIGTHAEYDRITDIENI